MLVAAMAGRIPEAFINDLLARTDIVEVIDERVALKKAGKNWQARCPFHEERTPSFTVSPDKQFYYCFGCGASGSAIGFVMDYERLDFIEAVHELAARAGLAVPTEGGAPARPVDHGRLYVVLEQVQQYYSRQLREHAQAARAKDYLKGRGLDGRTAAGFRLGYAPPGWDPLLQALGSNAEAVNALEAAGMLVPKDGGGHYDRFRDRIMFPIQDRRGRVIGFGGRIIDAGEPKYVNSPETAIFHKGSELYGLFHARQANRQLQRLLVVEGYMDVIALHQHGVTNAVATLGTATTADHLARLFRATAEVVFCFDGDEAGRKAAWRALETSLPLLKEGRYASFLFVPAGEDPDTLVRRQGPGWFDEPTRMTPLSDFLLDTLTAQVNLATLDGRARLVDLAKPLIKPLPAGALKQLMAQRLGRLADLDLRSLAPMIGAGAAAPPAARLPRERQSPSLIRKTITLILHQPSLALSVQDPAILEKSGQTGAALLRELVELVRRSPHLTTGGLLEHWRERPEGRHLQKLLTQEMTTPDTGIEEEFVAAISKLRQQAVKAIRAELARKPLREWSEEDRRLYRCTEDETPRH